MTVEFQFQRIVSFFIVGLLGSAAVGSLAAKSKKINGFDVSNATVPRKEIFYGGVLRDAIPAINNPKFVSVNQAKFLRPSDSVVSVTFGETTRAYPIRILNHHEIVNDGIGDEHFAVTYCPLCGTAMVFDRNVAGTVRTFGVSGLLYKSDVLMYDRESESLWSQLGNKAISGPMVGTALKWRNSHQVNWESWKKRFPDGEVLSTKTGFSRSYRSNPYVEYERSPGTMFSVPLYRRDLAQKEWVFGIVVDGRAKAYQAAVFPRDKVFSDTINGRKIMISLDSESGAFQAVDAASGDVIPSVRVYWFAWQAFYPDSELLTGNKPRKDR